MRVWNHRANTDLCVCKSEQTPMPKTENTDTPHVHTHTEPDRNDLVKQTLKGHTMILSGFVLTCL